MHGGSVRLGGPARAGSAWCGWAIVELVVPDGAADRLQVADSVLCRSSVCG